MNEDFNLLEEELGNTDNLIADTSETDLQSVEDLLDAHDAEQDGSDPDSH